MVYSRVGHDKITVFTPTRFVSTAKIDEFKSFDDIIVDLIYSDTMHHH